MNFILLKSRAKINIALDVIGKRPDGYHELQTIMQTLNLYDSILIKKVDKFPFKLVCNLCWLPTDEKNIVHKTANLLIERYNIKEGVFIELQKNIPVSAGLGGGSGNCAATLIGMRKLFNLPITNRELSEIGASLGADVPYCLKRGTVLAEGIGDKLTKLPSHPPVHVVLVRPPVAVSTAMVFGKLKLNEITVRPNIPAIMQALEQGDVKNIAGNFCNVLETVTHKLHPVILDIKNKLTEQDALGTLMSGSGPTVFAYFHDYRSAKKAISEIKKSFPNIRDIFLSSIFNPKKH